MRFQNVALAGLAHHLPERVVSSLEIEERLAPVYDRLRLRPGRLELMSGIRERRAWPAGTRPSGIAAEAGSLALGRAGIDPARIGTLVHASVCRDFLEPATASVVHSHLGLPPTCAAFDLSNACLGFANAMALTATQIEAGQIDAALVVAGEDGGPLVETTIDDLNRRTDLTRDGIKGAFASLTIGSGAAAMVLCRRDLAPGAPRLLGGLARAATEHHVLCQGGLEGHATGPLMETDSEALLHAGCALAAETWPAFLGEMEWAADSIDRVVTHQVGVAHRRLTLTTLDIDPGKDFPTVETLGNIGSVSLPLCLSQGIEAGFLAPGQRIAMLGIGSGLHCLMLGVELP